MSTIKKITASILIYLLSSCTGDSRQAFIEQPGVSLLAQTPARAGRISLVAGKYTYFSECSDKGKSSELLSTQGVDGINGFALDEANNIYTYQNICEEVKKITPSGLMTTPDAYAGVGKDFGQRLIGYSKAGELYAIESAKPGFVMLSDSVVRYDRDGKKTKIDTFLDRVTDAYLAPNDELYVLYPTSRSDFDREYKISKFDKNLHEQAFEIKVDTSEKGNFTRIAVNSKNEIYISQAIPAPTFSGFKYKIHKANTSADTELVFQPYFSEETRLGLPTKAELVFPDGPREREVGFSYIYDFAFGKDDTLYIAAGSFLFKAAREKASILVNYKDFKSELSWYNLNIEEIMAGNDGFVYFSDGNNNIFKTSTQS